MALVGPLRFFAPEARTLTNDAFKLYLVDHYHITKHPTLGQFVWNEKLYETLEQALEAARAAYDAAVPTEPLSEHEVTGRTGAPRSERSALRPWQRAAAVTAGLLVLTAAAGIGMWWYRSGHGATPAALAPTLGTPPVTRSPTPRRPALPNLTAADARNATYSNVTAEADSRVTLRDGQADLAYGGWAKAGEIALGDLDGDGAKDAAVVLLSNGGGNAVFTDVYAVLSREGGPVVMEPVDLDGTVTRVSIEDGILRVAAKVYAPLDGRCCPSVAVTRLYQVSGSKLVRVP